MRMASTLDSSSPPLSYLVANVMDPSAGVPLHKSMYGAILTQGLQKLQL